MAYENFYTKLLSKIPKCLSVLSCLLLLQLLIANGSQQKSACRILHNFSPKCAAFAMSDSSVVGRCRWNTIWSPVKDLYCKQDQAKAIFITGSKSIRIVSYARHFKLATLRQICLPSDRQGARLRNRASSAQGTARALQV